jgi:hypothetical protein
MAPHLLIAGGPDALPAGAIFKGVNAARKGIGILEEESVSAGAAKQIRKAGLAGKGEEIHHTVALNGRSRSAQDWRNHYAFLKTLPQETDRRLTGSWNGKPQFDPIRRAWHGTTDWQKAVPAAVASCATDAWKTSLGRSHRPGLLRKSCDSERSFPPKANRYMFRLRSGAAA